MTSAQKKPGSFQGSLFWVNHDADNMKAAPNRHQVFTHIQQKYRRWKRDETTKALRQSAQLPPNNPPTKNEATEKAIPGLATVHSGPCSPGSVCSLCEAEMKKASNLVTEGQAPNIEQVKAAKLKNVSDLKLMQRPGFATLFKGNSDPFGSFAVPISPMANNIISAIRSYILPSMYYLDSKKFQASVPGTRDWNLCVGSLEDAGAGYALIARYGSIVATISQDPAVQRQVLLSRVKSTEILRSKVAQGAMTKTEGSLNFYWHVNMLLGAEVLDGNYNAARIHATALATSFKADAAAKRLDLQTVLYAMYNDYHLSVMLLEPPIFDVLEWCPTVFAPIWAAGDPLMAPYSPEVNDPLDYAILEDLELTFLFIKTRQTVHSWMRRNDFRATQTALHLAWMTSRIYTHRGQIMCFYDKVRRRNRDVHLGGMFDGCKAQEYISLAMVLMTREMTSFTVAGVRIYDANPKILARLKLLMVETERPMNHPAWEKYKNARFWVLYTASMVEIDRRLKKQFLIASSPQVDDHYFEISLKNHAANMGIWKWKDAQAILREFIYSDGVQPCGSEWFEPLIMLHQYWM